MTARSSVVFALLALGCSCETYCDCLPCPPALSITIVAPGATPTVTGDVELDCTSLGNMTQCVSREREPVEPGTYVFVITAPGYAPAEATLVVRPGTTGCCACAVQGDATTVELGATDGGVALDAGLDGGVVGTDGGSSDSGKPDAGADDAALPTCRPERVWFPRGGDLSPGTFCDDVFVCVADEAEAERLMAASSNFICGDVGAPCEGVGCAFLIPESPAFLDEAEIQAICAVTLLEPPPERIMCIVHTR